jgi:FlaA1/EpsC-like NDP-sugar epimerase
VRPTNIIGASKRFAELILQGLAQVVENNSKISKDQIGTHFCMVRFGNVLGSSGSVVPLFQAQIHNGGPVTVTHPEIIRYFMTIPEAAQLVIQASAMGTKGEVFVLDMGEPVKILDLAKRMIHLSGLTVKDERNPDGDIEIKITGLRSGEKLYEELLIGDNATGTQHPRIMQAEETSISFYKLTEIINQLENSIEQYDIENIIKILSNTVSGYVANKGIRDYVWMAKNSEVKGENVFNNGNVIGLNDKLTTKENKQ